MPESRATVIGGGPAGLMAADVLSAGGVPVDLYDAMPSVGRKFLLAGIGGMNITHSEALPDFIARYGERSNDLRGMLEEFGNEDLREWIHQLGIETFVGSSGRVFPKEMKAAPLLRAWLHRLREQGVRIHTRHRWQGWDENGKLLFLHRELPVTSAPDATVLALGGGSWKRLGSDGAWLPWLRQRGVLTSELLPSNCGFECEWSDVHRQRFAGKPVKNIAMRLPGDSDFRKGEFLVTDFGIEGSLVYALSAQIRDALHMGSKVTVEIDLLPDVTLEKLAGKLSHSRGHKSFSEFLRRRAGLEGVKASILREVEPRLADLAVEDLAHAIKRVHLPLLRPRPVDEAISTAGGVEFSAMTPDLMLIEIPGVFCAGEMLGWEAPTGGYLLTACFTTGRRAGEGALRWISDGAGKFC